MGFSAKMPFADDNSLSPGAARTVTVRVASQHIDYGYLPAAHTDGDLYIHFPERRADLARHRDMYQQLFKKLFAYLNKGFGPTDVIAAHPLEEHEAEFGDPAAFLEGAYRSVFLAYVPD